jgi:hypothetical protein
VNLKSIEMEVLISYLKVLFFYTPGSLRKSTKTAIRIVCVPVVSRTGKLPNIRNKI